MAAIIPKIPEKVPAKKEFKVFLLISHPKKEPAPAIKTIALQRLINIFRISLIIIRVQLVLLLIGLE